MQIRTNSGFVIYDSRRRYFMYMGAAWSVSDSGYRFLMRAAENGEPIELDSTDARQVKRAPTGTLPLVGRQLRQE